MTTNEIRAEIRHLEQCDGRDGDCAAIYEEVSRLKGLLPEEIETYEHPQSHMRKAFKLVKTAPRNALEDRFYNAIQAKPTQTPEEILELFSIAERHVLAAHWFCDIGQHVPGYLSGATKQKLFAEPFRPYYRHEGFRLLSTQGEIVF